MKRTCLPLVFGLFQVSLALGLSVAAPTRAQAQDSKSILPAGSRPEGTVTEKELASLIRRLSERLHVRAQAEMTVENPTAPVKRLRALAVLAKALVSAKTLESYKKEMPEPLPSDMDEVPEGYRVYVAAAVGEGWVAVDKPLRVKQIVTWSYLQDLADKMAPADRSAGGTNRDDTEKKEAPKEDEPFTGLIVDTGDLKAERTPSVRILDEDGSVVYPDEKHIPDADWVEDHGMAAYCVDRNDTERAGRHPLTVKTLRLAGPGKDEIVVSKEDAALIRQANARSKFLWKWAVCILTVKKS